MKTARGGSARDDTSGARAAEARTASGDGSGQVTVERPDRLEPDPLEAEDLEDSWEPPDPALGGPGQLVVAVVVAFLIAAVVVAAVAGLSWLFR